MKPLDHLAIIQINRRLRVIRTALKEAKVSPGWICYIRQALNMSLKNLADRAGVSIGTVAQAERGEAAGKVTVKTLKEMAGAMNCKFVYAFVPKEDLDEILKKEAVKKAKQLLSRADTHMTLEDQRVTESYKDRVARLAKKLLEKGDVW